MIDREKVIKGLTCRLACGCMNEDDCNPECPYLGDPRACYGLDEDALALLKMQENSIPIDWLMQYAQLPTEIAISAWNKPMKDALKAQLRNADKPMPFDDALQLVDELLPPMKEGE